MEKAEDMRTLVEIAYMYYDEDATQDEIAKKFNMSRSLVSRYLKKCREYGIVEFVINDELIHPYHDIERKLKAQFQLKDVICVGGHTDRQLQKRRVGVATAKYLMRHLKSNSTVAVTGGTTINEVANAVSSPVEFPDVSFVSMVGGLGKENQNMQSNVICDVFAAKLQSNSIHLDAPVLVDTAEAKKVFLQQSYIKNVMTAAKNADFALLGIGGHPEHSSIAKAYSYYLESQRKESTDSIVGDICYNFIDINGRLVDCEWNRRVLSLGADQIRNIPNVICTVEGLEKVVSISAVLKAALIDTLIIDENTATALLEYRP